MILKFETHLFIEVTFVVTLGFDNWNCSVINSYRLNKLFKENKNKDIWINSVTAESIISDRNNYWRHLISLALLSGGCGTMCYKTYIDTMGYTYNNH